MINLQETEKAGSLFSQLVDLSARGAFRVRLEQGIAEIRKLHGLPHHTKEEVEKAAVLSAQRERVRGIEPEGVILEGYFCTLTRGNKVSIALTEIAGIREDCEQNVLIASISTSTLSGKRQEPAEVIAKDVINYLKDHPSSRKTITTIAALQ